MKKLLLVFSAIIFTSFMAINANAEGDSNTASHHVTISVDKFALVDIESNATNGDLDFNLDPVPPTEAGLGMTFSSETNSNLWLNYSSIVGDGKTRTISASVDNVLPAGISIQLSATTAGGSGKGILGTTSIPNPVTLTTGGVEVINGIGSCYTGNGTNAGSNLSYKAVVNDGSYGSIVQGEYTVTVTYTISDDN